jgi:hypothetical protein
MLQMSSNMWPTKTYPTHKRMKFQNSREVLDFNYFVSELHVEVALRHVPIIKDVKV